MASDGLNRNGKILSGETAYQSVLDEIIRYYQPGHSLLLHKDCYGNTPSKQNFHSVECDSVPLRAKTLRPYINKSTRCGYLSEC
jgi:hypothetical protein